MQEILSPKKSAQATLILVMVTMVAVLGVGITSSTKSRINLKETVYSTQSDQAINCAEAGAERALTYLNNSFTEGSNVSTLPSFNDAAFSGGNCVLTVTVVDYPNTGAAYFPNLKENNVQQLIFDNLDSIDINFRSLRTNNGILNISVYDGSSEPIKRFPIDASRCGGTDYSDIPSSSTTGTINGLAACRHSMGLVRDTVLRLRPVNDDYEVLISNIDSSNIMGYEITSTATTGSVKRQVKVYKYYKQLPAGFDEAVVNLE